VTWLTTILGLANGIIGLFSRALDYLKEIRLINWGKEQHAADLAKEEIEINRKQTEILNQDRTKADVVKRMEDGTF
jgi:hypothetical protein